MLDNSSKPLLAYTNPVRDRELPEDHPDNDSDNDDKMGRNSQQALTAAQKSNVATSTGFEPIG
jgi:hypothetical protein